MQKGTTNMTPLVWSWQAIKKFFLNLVNLQIFIKFTENCMCLPQFYKAFSKYKITIAMFMHK